MIRLTAWRRQRVKRHGCEKGIPAPTGGAGRGMQGGVAQDRSGARAQAAAQRVVPAVIIRCVGTGGNQGVQSGQEGSSLVCIRGRGGRHCKRWAWRSGISTGVQAIRQKANGGQCVPNEGRVNWVTWYSASSLLGRSGGPRAGHRGGLAYSRIAADAEQLAWRGPHSWSWRASARADTPCCEIIGLTVRSGAGSHDWRHGGQLQRTQHRLAADSLVGPLLCRHRRPRGARLRLARGGVAQRQAAVGGQSEHLN